MIQEMHERSRISGDASIEEPSRTKPNMKQDSVDFTVGTESIDAEKKQGGEISGVSGSIAPIELGTYDISKFESTEQSLKENPMSV